MESGPTVVDPMQWRIQDFSEGDAGRGGHAQPGELRVQEGGVRPPARSTEAFEYIVYEASWFHVHHAVAASSQ